MKTKPAQSRVQPEPVEELIRDYAHHLFEQHGRLPGHDLDHWLEAEACILAHIAPRRSPRGRARRAMPSTAEIADVESTDTDPPEP